MRLFYAIVFFSAGLLLATPNVVYAGPEQDAYQAVVNWAGLVSQCKAGCNVSQVARQISSNFYTPEALLHPTASDELKVGRPAIEGYFEKTFLPKQPKADLLDGYKTITVVAGHAYLFVGFYDFGFGRPTPSCVRARYSFLMVLDAGKWLIAHQHSSKLPEHPECRPQ